MAEEPPGNWELQRSLAKLSADLKDGLAQINTRLDSMVSTGVHDAQMGRVDDRLKEISEDVAQEREARKADLAKESAARIADQAAEREARKADMADLRAQMERTAVWLRWVAAAVILPIALFVGSILLNVKGTGGLTP
ncbi:MAG: hypothetical protein ACRDQA_26265 [Nocardioidaceae bacterium]